MKSETALSRYLQRHIEPGLPDAPCASARWRNALVIPAYREAPALLKTLRLLPRSDGRSLVILVLNRPDSDSDPNANADLRDAARQLCASPTATADVRIQQLNDYAELYVHDLEAARGPSAASQGVGLARKVGCDIALRWMAQGGISSHWIYSSDADAQLPADYFKRVASLRVQPAAALFPFRHIAGTDIRCDQATALYELRLHHYVLGLAYAGSPYAYHTLGSCLAIQADAYAQVRGFPRRAGAEDFYLLNKLAKVGPVVQLPGQCIQLLSRPSRRVPFGTGPAVAAIAGADAPADLKLFYHPACFVALRAVLHAIEQQCQAPAAVLEDQLAAQGLAPDLARASTRALNAMALPAAIAHCHRQGKSQAQFMRQFHQWFDAFRSLKFVHAIRDAGWPEQSLASLQDTEPNLWPHPGTADEAEQALETRLARHLGWTS